MKGLHAEYDRLSSSQKRGAQTGGSGDEEAKADLLAAKKELEAAKVRPNLIKGQAWADDAQREHVPQPCVWSWCCLCCITRGIIFATSSEIVALDPSNFGMGVKMFCLAIGAC